MVPDKWHGLSVLKPPKLPILKTAALPRSHARPITDQKNDDVSMEQTATANEPVYA